MAEQIEFVNPSFFWLFLALPLFIGWSWFFRNKERPSLLYPTIKGFQVKPSLRIRMYPILLLFRVIAFCMMVVALARPRISSQQIQTKTSQGIDIVLSADISTSMLAKDLKPNRLEALKSVALDFVKARINDRIGLVVYAGESYTKIPITFDKGMIQKGISDLDFGQIEDGTAIGLGLATAVNRLKDSKAKSRIIILMTDGVNNKGAINPITAANLAKQYGIKVYTIGIGTNGMALFPVGYNYDGSFRYDMAQVEIDEDLLKEIAQITLGKYFRVTNNQKLVQVYNEIDKLEKSENEEIVYYQYKELFRYAVFVALILLLLEFLLRNTVFRSFV